MLKYLRPRRMESGKFFYYGLLLFIFLLAQGRLVGLRLKPNPAWKLAEPSTGASGYSLGLDVEPFLIPNLKGGFNRHKP